MQADKCNVEVNCVLTITTVYAKYEAQIAQVKFILTDSSKFTVQLLSRVHIISCTHCIYQLAMNSTPAVTLDNAH